MDPADVEYIGYFLEKSALLDRRSIFILSQSLLDILEPPHYFELYFILL